MWNRVEEKGGGCQKFSVLDRIVFLTIPLLEIIFNPLLWISSSLLFISKKFPIFLINSPYNYQNFVMFIVIDFINFYRYGRYSYFHHIVFLPVVLCCWGIK